MYAIPVGTRFVKFLDNSSDEEDSRKANRGKSKKHKKSKKTSSGCGPLLYASGPLPMRFPPGAAPIYASPPPPRPIFAAHIQVNPVVQPVVPCRMIAVTHTQLYPRSPPPTGLSVGPPPPPPSATYVLQNVNQTPAAVAAAGAYSAVRSPFMVPIFSG